METLLINFVNGRWIAEVSNTNFLYTFAGADPAAQQLNVQALANAMQQGEDQVIASVRQIFGDIPATEPDFMVVENLFSTTSELDYMATERYIVAVGEDLLDEIVSAGAWLLGVL